MKTNEIMKSVSLTFNKVGFQLQKKSPEILVAAGVVGVVVSAVMACQATPKALKVAEKTQDDVERIQSAEDSGVTQAGETYTKEDARGDRMQVYAHTSTSGCMPPPFCWARRPSPASSPATSS